MLPKFPDFKHVEVGDRADVEAHTHRFDPYSDFNFTSLYAWDTDGNRMISELNGNLVVKFTDYSTHEPFLSFLGNNETEHTARTLIDYCKENNLPTTLKLVPEISTQGIRPSVLKIEEDRDNFDYVYSVPELSALKGSKYISKRQAANRFLRENPDSRVEVIDLNDDLAQSELLRVIGYWKKNKVENNKDYELAHELTAIKRLFESSNSHTLILLGIFFSDVLTAFSIEELLPNQNSIAHFWKADVTSKGVYEYLLQEKAKHLETLGATFLNYEQDLGVESLRMAKTSLRPVTFLKKYLLEMP